MVTIRFKLNKENIQKLGFTEQNIIDFLHRFYVKERRAVEIAPLTFQRDDENAMCDFGDILSPMQRSSDFMSMFAECTWNVDGEEEDIIAETIDYMRNHPRKPGKRPR